MRTDLKDLPLRQAEHAGLAYDVLAPLDEKGEIPDTRKEDWLESVADIEVPRAYDGAFKRWERSFGPRDKIAILTLDARLLVGHGNPAPSQVGLTLHHTWGVPIIPGSALKGLCAQYVETTYGPETPTAAPWEDAERGAFQGVTWADKRILRGPGEAYRGLFGAPDAEEDVLYREQEALGDDGYAAGAAQGLVTFHDALYIPGSCRQDDGRDLPLAPDVLTVHQKSYYDGANCTAQPEPNDYDDPVPVGFLTVRPRAHFRLALSGPEDWVTLAAYLLAEALGDWGAGGKTAAGYGQGTVSPWETPAPLSSPLFASFMDWIAHPVDQATGERINNDRKRIDYIHDQWAARLMGMSQSERARAAEEIQRRLGNVGLGGAKARRRAKLLACLAADTPAPDCSDLDA